MTEKDIVRKLMKIRKWSQPMLAKEAKFPSASNITGFLNNNKNGIRMDNFYKMVSAMGYEIVIRDKMGDREEFVVDMVEEEVE
jgi:hypothetical protein